MKIWKLKAHDLVSVEEPQSGLRVLQPLLKGKSIYTEKRKREILLGLRIFLIFYLLISNS